MTEVTLERWHLESEGTSVHTMALEAWTSQKPVVFLANGFVGEEFVISCFLPLMPHDYLQAQKAKSLILIIIGTIWP